MLWKCRLKKKVKKCILHFCFFGKSKKKFVFFFSFFLIYLPRQRFGYTNLLTFKHSFVIFLYFRRHSFVAFFILSSISQLLLLHFIAVPLDFFCAVSDSFFCFSIFLFFIFCWSSAKMQIRHWSSMSALQCCDGKRGEGKQKKKIRENEKLTLREKN